MDVRESFGVLRLSAVIGRRPYYEEVQAVDGSRFCGVAGKRPCQTAQERALLERSSTLVRGGDRCHAAGHHNARRAAAGTRVAGLGCARILRAVPDADRRLPPERPPAPL